MAPTRLNQAKLHVPGLTAAPVVRESLLRRLDAHRGRLVLVSAPAGFGKTVLVADWIARRSEPSAWLSLDALDEEPSRLGAHLAAALQSLGAEDFRVVAEAVLKAASSDGRPADELRESLEAVTAEGVLVLDDLHEVESPQGLRIIEPLIHAPRSRLRIVLVTRADPALPLARLRLSGQLVEVRAGDLAFSREEAAQLLEGMKISSLAPSQLATLMERTEGWPAGLRLAGIALADAEDPDTFVTSFAGTNRFVTEYLLEEAVGRQPARLQQFLMESAVLSRFDEGGCREVLGDPEAHDRLGEARAASLFLVPLGADDTWYRYHHLFGELLTYRLGRTRPERLEELRLRASRWFETQGDLEEALEQAAQMAGKDRLLELLDRYGLTMISRSELTGIRRWLGQVDTSVVGPYPLAWCTEAWLRIVTERVADPMPLIRRIEVALELAGEDYDPQQRTRALLHTRVLAAYAARYRHQWEKALELGQEAEALLTDQDPLTRGFLIYNAARVRMALGEMSEASALLRRAFPDHLHGGNHYLVLATLGRIAAIRAQTDGVSASLEALDTAMAFAREHGLDANPALSIVHLHGGWTHLLADALEEAESAFESALQAAGAQDFPEERGNALVGLARVASARGDVAQAEAHLREVSALGQAGNVDLFETTLELERLHLALRRESLGVGPPAPELARYLSVSEDDGGPWTTLREAATILALQRALLSPALDSTENRLAGRLMEESTRRERGPATVIALLFLAMETDTPGRWDLVDEALQMIRSRGYVRPVLELGPAAASLLRSAVQQPRLSLENRLQAEGILASMSPVAEGMEPGETAPPSEDEGGVRLAGAVPLTEREREVLELLFQGMTNKELARHLFVTVDTVKTHLKHIYAKLGVANRSQAIRRARELGFTPEAD
jgi:LuxR family maltose regulon positive regulatory protein